MDDLISEFIEETNESLSLLDQELVRFEQDPSDKDILSNIFRVMHTIKGTCGFLALPRLERVAHAGEDVLGKFRDGTLDVTPTAVSLILKCLDQIGGLLSNLSETGEEGPETSFEEELIGDLRAMADGETPAASETVTESVSAETQDPDESVSAQAPEGFPVAAEFLAEFEEATKASDAAASKPVADSTAVDEPVSAEVTVLETATKPQAVPTPAAVPDAEKKKDRPPAATQSIRVNVEVLENLMTMVSEMVLTRNQLLQLTRSEGETLFAEPVQRLSRITSELQEGVMKTRMQPIGNAWNKLPRIVRDLTGDLGKKIDIVMSGEETELDRQVLELIQDPLTHMVRNSVDHGVETPADRLAAGKTENGTIFLSAYHEGGHIIIEIKDDGKGLDTDVIRQKVVEKGLATAEEVDAMDDARIGRFILEPGFSTAKAVTKVSGRGVGMDVVRSNIEKIGGVIDFTSTFGVGSTFTIKIPLTLSIVAALIVESCAQRFAIPQIAVSEVVRISGRSEHRLETLKGAPVMRLRSKLLPLIDLNGLLKIGESLELSDSAGLGFEGYVVVCRIGSRQVGVLVDKISDSEEIVVKPLSPIIPNATFFSGNTILGDGAVILILDTNGLASALSLDASQLGGEDELNDDAQSRTESILVFRTQDEGLCAVPLSTVHRIESFEMQNTEVVQGDAVIQYRDRLLPLMSMYGSSGIHQDGRQTVLVFGDDSEGIGLAIEKIVDIMEVELKIERASKSPEMLGSAVVGEHAVDILDPNHFRSMAGQQRAAITDLNINYGEAA